MRDVELRKLQRHELVRKPKNSPVKPRKSASKPSKSGASEAIWSGSA